jgi:hypothetical protein
MQVDVMELMRGGIYLTLIVALIVLSVLGVEAIKVVSRTRRLLDRIDLLTDIRGWLDLLRRTPRSKAKSR